MSFLSDSSKITIQQNLLRDQGGFWRRDPALKLPMGGSFFRCCLSCCCVSYSAEILHWVSFITSAEMLSLPLSQHLPAVSPASCEGELCSGAPAVEEKEKQRERSCQQPNSLFAPLDSCLVRNPKRRT